MSKKDDEGGRSDGSGLGSGASWLGGIRKGTLTLLRGLDSQGRARLALAACNAMAKGGMRALYLCKGPIALPDSEPPDENVLLGSYGSVEEIPGMLRALKPSLVAINPINPSCGSRIWPGGRLISGALFEISSITRAGGCVAILLTEEPAAATPARGGRLPRHYRAISRFCDLELRATPAGIFEIGSPVEEMAERRYASPPGWAQK